ncbi:tyrosine-type recombinase/integrase [Amorphus orientalis]|uniref:Integrase n=1 Tax=Amorphus orientalis TaxID=649198 RepID=A0AAE3VQQ2_9HYPH|nr:integrase family protein [Amorphus orientalis]MDQ0316426.1 integrase [Amorphus orientalis]
MTDLAIRKLPLLTAGQKRYWDEQTPGFGLTVGTRAKTFIVMYGTERRLKSIGRYPEIGLSDARKEAKRLLAHKPAQNRSERLTELVTAFLEDCEERLRPSSVARYADVLKRAPDISLEKVTKSLAATPHEVKAYKALFNWAMKEDLYDRNPFQHMRTVYGIRDRVLSDEELKKLWAYEHKPFSDIVKLLILTGQRKGQIARFDTEWIKGDTIHFPASVMKQGKVHTIPYGEVTEPYLQEFSFNSWSKAKERLDKQTGVTDWVLHDLRRTFATVHARLGTPIHIVEALLAHYSGQISGVTAIYVRHDFLKEQRAAVQEYESFIRSLM